MPFARAFARGLGRGLGFGALALGCALSLPGRAAEPKAPQETTRATMGRIFESMRVLLPLSVEDGAFRDPAQRARIEAALRNLAENASLLNDHGRERSGEFRFLGRSLARDARDALGRFERGHYEGAAFLVRDATENCIACHSRLPSPGDSPLAEQFIDEPQLRSLPAEERARLQIATRRFDDALSTLEALMASPAHPAELLLPLTDYLTVAIRVKRDLERPVPVLTRFSRRPDLWRNLRVDVEHWIAALQALGTTSSSEPSVALAKRVLEEAKAQARFPDDRGALVHYIVVSSLLERYLESQPGDDRDVAEAHFLLGTALSRIGSGFWLSHSDFLLERAVRLAPQEPFAEEAYATLEEEVMLSFAGQEIPADVARRLSELRSLLDAPPDPSATASPSRD